MKWVYRLVKQKINLRDGWLNFYNKKSNRFIWTPFYKKMFVVFICQISCKNLWLKLKRKNYEKSEGKEVKKKLTLWSCSSQLTWKIIRERARNNFRYTIMPLLVRLCKAWVILYWKCCVIPTFFYDFCGWRLLNVINNRTSGTIFNFALFRWYNVSAQQNPRLQIEQDTLTRRYF